MAATATATIFGELGELEFGQREGSGGFCEPCDRQIAKRIPWGCWLFHPQPPRHRECLAFSFCKFVFLVPFGFISVSAASLLVFHLPESECPFPPLPNLPLLHFSTQATQSLAVDKKVRVKRVPWWLHKFEL